jgi:beta-N-acetylhexosaminidase
MILVLALHAHALRGADSLDVRIGAMLMSGFRGLVPTEEILGMLREQHLGGVVLFDYDVERKEAVRNVASPEQLRSLIAALQAEVQYPLLVAVDQEGGRVSRLKERYGFPASVSQQQLAMTGDTAVTAAQAHRTGQLLRGLGFNVNFAPVVDVNSNPGNPIIGMLQRSYSSDPDSVAIHARAAVIAMREEGVMPVPKHFPGHGSSSGDTHEGFVDVTDSWDSSELLPYRALIGEGLVDMLMTAHIVQRKLDQQYPATLSHRIIDGLLRAELGFDGVVVTDDMQMKAIAGEYGFETALRRAIEAGADVLLFGNNTGRYEPRIAAKAHAAIRRMVENGRISRDRIEQSWRRITSLRQRLTEMRRPSER